MCLDANLNTLEYLLFDCVWVAIKGLSVQLFHAQSAALENTINSREADTVHALKIYMVLNDLLLNFTQFTVMALYSWPYQQLGSLGVGGTYMSSHPHVAVFQLYKKENMQLQNIYMEYLAYKQLDQPSITILQYIGTVMYWNYIYLYTVV